MISHVKSKHHKEILKQAKDIVDKETYKKLKKLNSEPDFISIVGYRMRAQLELKVGEYAAHIKEAKNHGKDTLFAEVALHRYQQKIKAYLISLSPQDLNKVHSSDTKLQKELKSC